MVSSTRKDFTWTNSHPIAGGLRMGVQKLKDATPAGVLLGSGKLAMVSAKPLRCGAGNWLGTNSPSSKTNPVCPFTLVEGAA